MIKQFIQALANRRRANLTAKDREAHSLYCAEFPIGSALNEGSVFDMGGYREPVGTPTRDLYPRMVQAVANERLEATLTPSEPAYKANFALSPDARKAAHAKSVATKAAKKAMTAALSREGLRRDLKASLEEGK